MKFYFGEYGNEAGYSADTLETASNLAKDYSKSNLNIPITVWDQNDIPATIFLNGIQFLKSKQGHWNLIMNEDPIETSATSEKEFSDYQKDISEITKKLSVLKLGLGIVILLEFLSYLKG